MRINSISVLLNFTEKNSPLDAFIHLFSSPLSHYMHFQSRQFYLRMSAIQSSHRRVVLVHCDQVTNKRIMDTAHRLDLFAGQKIWVVLDGVIGSKVTSPALWKHLNLPNGMLALNQRPPSLADSGKTLLAIIKVIGEALANTLVNSRSWSGLDNDFHNGSAPDVSCWKNASSARIKYSQIVYRLVCRCKCDYTAVDADADAHVAHCLLISSFTLQVMWSWRQLQLLLTQVSLYFCLWLSFCLCLNGSP